MSDEIVREYLNKDEPANNLMLLVNPFTKLSGWPALALGLLVVAATLVVEMRGGIRYDGIMDVHVGRGVALEPLADWLIVALLFLIGGLIWAPKTQSFMDYFGMSALGRLPFVLVGLIWTVPALRDPVMALASVNPTQIVSYLLDSGVLPWIVGGSIITMLIMTWGLFLNFFALREASGMKTGRAIGVYVGVIVVGEIISKAVACAVT